MVAKNQQKRNTYHQHRTPTVIRLNQIQKHSIEMAKMLTHLVHFLVLVEVGSVLEAEKTDSVEMVEMVMRVDLD